MVHYHRTATKLHQGEQAMPCPGLYVSGFWEAKTGSLFSVQTLEAVTDSTRPGILSSLAHFLNPAMK